jgi:LacI family transcriptional regulator
MEPKTEVRRKGRATIIDVGRVAGVSDATVSRALNNPETVSKATRQRIDDAIIQTGYVPNPLAKAMVSGRTYTVGALVPTLDHAIFSKFLNTLEGELSTNGYSLVVAVTDGDPVREVEKAKKLLAMGVEGLVVSGLSHNAELVDQAHRFKIPLVATSYFEADSLLPTIGYDNEKAAQMAADHLISLGHHTIAVLHGPIQNNDRTRSRLKGLKEIQSPVSFEFIGTTLDYAGGSKAALKISNAASAVLCLSDILAMGVLFKLQDQGVRVPGDISLMGFDDMAPSEFLSPALTTLKLPIAQMGQATAVAICHYLKSGSAILSHELIPEIVIRRSTARLIN